MRNKIAFIVQLLFFSISLSSAQKITFSESEQIDNKNLAYEIIGKSNENLVIYKKINKTHYICFYDQEMKIIKNIELEKIPPNALKLNFVNSNECLLIIFQYIKNNKIYCDAVRYFYDNQTIKWDGNLLQTKNEIFSNEDRFIVSVSENKKSILIYKLESNQKKYILDSKNYDNNLNVIDSCHYDFSYSSTKDYCSDLIINNEGDYFFAKQTKKKFLDNYETLEILYHHIHSDSLISIPVPLQNNYINPVLLKSDNLNKNLIFNSFYLSEIKDNVIGLFSATIKPDKKIITKIKFNFFGDSLRMSVRSLLRNKYRLDNLQLQSMILKKNGGFALLAEDIFSEVQYTNFNNSNNLSTTNSYYNGSYLGNNQNNRVTKYNYNDILIMNLDSSLSMSSYNVINKTQFDFDDENHLSYFFMNTGKEIQFLFSDNYNKTNIVNNLSLYPNGEITRHATLKNVDKEFEYMPKFAKQIGTYKLVLPFLYQKKLGFAKVEW